MRLELSIIIVNWNSGALLRPSVESVMPARRQYEIVIVDNASTDDSVAMLGASELTRELTHQGCLRIIENSENRGFGPANNQAFGLTDAPLLLLLNPDTEVTPGSIDRLIATVQARLLNANGSLQISVWRNPPTAWEIMLSQLKLYLLWPRSSGVNGYSGVIGIAVTEDLRRC